MADRSNFGAGKMLSSQMYKEAGLGSLLRHNMASSSVSSPMCEYFSQQCCSILDPRTWCITCCVFLCPFLIWGTHILLLPWWMFIYNHFLEATCALCCIMIEAVRTVLTASISAGGWRSSSYAVNVLAQGGGRDIRGHLQTLLTHSAAGAGRGALS